MIPGTTQCLAPAEWIGGSQCENVSVIYASEDWPDSCALPLNVGRDKTGLYWIDGVFFHRESSKLGTFKATDFRSWEEGTELGVLFPAWLIGYKMLLKLTSSD